MDQQSAQNFENIHTDIEVLYISLNTLCGVVHLLIEKGLISYPEITDIMIREGEECKKATDKALRQLDANDIVQAVDQFFKEGKD